MAFDGTTIPYPDNSFDLVFAACVFHHIPHSKHVGLLGEWQRVLKPGGTAVIFEHSPLSPLTVRAVNTRPFDENAEFIPAPAKRERMLAAGFGELGLCLGYFFPAIYGYCVQWNAGCTGVRSEPDIWLTRLNRRSPKHANEEEVLPETSRYSGELLSELTITGVMLPETPIYFVDDASLDRKPMEIRRGNIWSRGLVY